MRWWGGGTYEWKRHEKEEGKMKREKGKEGDAGFLPSTVFVHLLGAAPILEIHRCLLSHFLWWGRSTEAWSVVERISWDFGGFPVATIFAPVEMYLSFREWATQKTVLLVMVQKSQTTTWDGAKTLWIMGQATYQLVQDFWTINSSTVGDSETSQKTLQTLNSPTSPDNLLKSLVGFGGNFWIHPIIKMLLLKMLVGKRCSCPSNMSVFFWEVFKNKHHPTNARGATMKKWYQVPGDSAVVSFLSPNLEVTFNNLWVRVTWTHRAPANLFLVNFLSRVHHENGGKWWDLTCGWEKKPPRSVFCCCILDLPNHRQWKVKLKRDISAEPVFIQGGDCRRVRGHPQDPWDWYIHLHLP